MRGPRPELGRVGHDGFLERRHQLPHAQPAALQIDERINHELARSVVGDLPATIDLDHRNVARLRERARGFALSPKVKTGGCSSSQISSGVAASRSSVKRCIARHVGS